MNADLGRFHLEREQTLMVIVDVQERLVPTMPQKIYGRTLGGIRFLAESARKLQVPVVATEQYPKGLGHTVEALAGAGTDAPIEKVSFGCCGEPGFLEYLRGKERRQILVTGMEAHVCVYQTVLGLLAENFEVHLVRDAIISRGKIDYLNALELAREAGAVVTTAETAVFQLMRSSAIPEFKAISALVKERFAGE